MTDNLLDTCIKVFRHSGENYKYQKDTHLDYWKTPDEFRRDGGGDCEDWCLFWREQLMKEDVPETHIFMTWIPWTPKESHMILLIQDGDKYHCLNVLSYFVGTLRMEDLIETFGQEGERWFMFTAEDTYIPQWVDYLQRSKEEVCSEKS